MGLSNGRYMGNKRGNITRANRAGYETVIEITEADEKSELDDRSTYQT
ncbi:MAG: hypothetical protein WA631_11215 [Nitrososphaeraceae archaeon]